MGKKPVVAIVGLIWAGMALVGCENCKNCRNRNTAPTYTPTGGAPVVRQDAPASPSLVAPTAGGPGKAETTRAADPVGTQGFDKSAVGTPASAGATPAPTNQTSLSSPGPDARPTSLPGQDAAYRSGETPISKSVPSDGGFRMPPRPVSPVSASVPTGTTDSLLKNPTPSALPTPPTTPTGLMPPPPSMTSPLISSSPPQAPASPMIGSSNAMPMPVGSGNAMPSFDPPSK